MTTIRTLFAALVFGCAAHTAFAEQPPPPLAAYGRLPAMEMPTLSNSGQRVAAIGSIGGKRTLMAYEITGAPLYAIELIDINVSKLIWAGENYVVGVTNSTQDLGWRFDNEDTLENIFVIDLAKKTLVWPLQKQNEVMDASFGFYGVAQQEGRWYTYFAGYPVSVSNATGKNYLVTVARRLFKIDLETGKFSKVAVGRNNAQDWLVGNAGQVLANDTYDGATAKWALYAGGYDGPLLVQATDAHGGNRIVGEGRGDGTILYVVSDPEGAAHYMEGDLSGKAQPVEVTPEELITAFVSNPGTRKTIGYVTTGNVPKLVAFDAAYQRRIRDVRSAFPGLDAQFMSWNAGFTSFVMLTTGQTDAGTYFLVDAVKGTARALGSLYPEIKAAQIGPSRVVEYKAADGLELEGILTLPSGREARSLPVVVLPHGGPQVRDYLGFNWWAQAFASRGYAVWQPNFRGSGGYGVDFRNAGFGEWGRKMQTDISDGVTELAKQGIVDPRRACIVGGSYGGYAALAGVMVQHGLYRCAVSVNGVSGLQAFTVREDKRKDDGTVRYWDSYLGSGDLSAVSPIKLASSADAPVLLIHGTGDTVVSIEQSRSMAKALRSADKSVELLELESSDHSLSSAKARTAMLEAAVPFVMKHNPPGAPPPN